MANPFNVSETCNQILNAAKLHMGEGWKKSKTTFEEFTESNKERLQMLATLAAAGELTEEQLESKLKGETEMLEAQLNALKVVSIATVQKTVNSIYNILAKAVSSVIPM